MGNGNVNGNNWWMKCAYIYFKIILNTKKYSLCLHWQILQKHVDKEYSFKRIVNKLVTRSSESQSNKIIESKQRASQMFQRQHTTHTQELMFYKKGCFQQYWMSLKTFITHKCVIFATGIKTVFSSR